MDVGFFWSGMTLNEWLSTTGQQADPWKEYVFVLHICPDFHRLSQWKAPTRVQRVTGTQVWSVDSSCFLPHRPSLAVAMLLY